jgi:hypothetical protein
MGYGISHDSALGLLGETQVSRPHISSETTGINWEDSSYTLSLYLPSKAYAGEFYDGQIRIQNTTNLSFLKIFHYR